MYIQVQFKKDIEPNEEKLKIKITNGFFSMYKNKNGLAFPKLVIMDFEILEYNNTQGNSTDDTSSDLPF